MAAKKSAQANGATPKVSKSAFIRNHPSLSAPAVIAKAKEQGITLTASHVYGVRAAVRGGSAPSGGATAPRRGRPPKAPTAPHTAAASRAERASDERQFAAFVVNIGLLRAEALLEGIRSNLQA